LSEGDGTNSLSSNLHRPLPSKSATRALPFAPPCETSTGSIAMNAALLRDKNVPFASLSKSNPASRTERASTPTWAGSNSASRCRTGPPMATPHQFGRTKLRTLREGYKNCKSGRNEATNLWKGYRNRNLQNEPTERCSKGGQVIRHLGGRKGLRVNDQTRLESGRLDRPGPSFGLLVDEVGARVLNLDN